MPNRDQRVRDAEAAFRAAADIDSIAGWAILIEAGVRSTARENLERARMALRDAVVMQECGGGS